MGARHRDGGHGREHRADNDPRRRPADGWRTRDAARFRELVQDTLASLPAELATLALNARLICRDVPVVPAPEGAERLDQIVFAEYVPGGPDRDAAVQGADAGASLTVYRRPLEGRAATREDLLHLIRLAVGEEIARAIGIVDWRDGEDDEDL